MATPPTQAPVYLARGSYRQRRLRDVARMLPVAGAVLWLLPVLYLRPSTGYTGLYIFGVWVLLILVAAVISYRMSLSADDTDTPTDIDDVQ